MRLLTNFFSSAATKFPVITIIVIIGITGFFGYMTTQAEELDTGFGGEIDTPEIEAQGKLSDYFGGSGTQSVLQLVFEGEDVLTVEGYETYTAAVEVIKNSELYQYLVNDPNQGLVQGFFAPIDVAKAFNPMLDVSSLTDEQFKQHITGDILCDRTGWMSRCDAMDRTWRLIYGLLCHHEIARIFGTTKELIRSTIHPTNRNIRHPKRDTRERRGELRCRCTCHAVAARSTTPSS